MQAHEESDSSPPVEVQASERRAFIRYPRVLEGLWQFLGVASVDVASGSIFDLSASGVGMALDRPFAPGTTLFVRLPSATLGWISHLVRVMHCSEQAPAVYRVGCRFVKPLTGKQLQAYLAQ